MWQAMSEYEMVGLELRYPTLYDFHVNKIKLSLSSPYGYVLVDSNIHPHTRQYSGQIVSLRMVYRGSTGDTDGKLAGLGFVVSICLWKPVMSKARYLIHLGGEKENKRDGISHKPLGREGKGPRM
jgi:hypothetical protein